MEKDKSHFLFAKIRVNDLDRCAEFYATVCQLKEVNRVSGELDGKKYHEVMFLPTSESGTAFVLISIEDEVCEPSNTTIGFVTGDIDGFVTRATSGNGSVVRSITDVPEHGAKIVFIADPEGNQLEVIQKV